MVATRLAPMSSRRRFVWELLRRTYREFSEDDCLHMAAGVAYYALFSLFPLLLGVIALLGAAIEPQEVQKQIVELSADYFPGSADLVAGTLAQVVSERRTLGLLALLGFLWSGSAVFAAIRRSLNRAWDVPQRPLLKQKLVELAMMIGVGSLFITSMGTGAMLRFVDEVAAVLGQQPTLGREIALNAYSFATIFAVVLLMYRFVPNAKVRWSDIWPAALLVAVLFEAGKRGFMWYLETQALQSYSLTYGPLAAVMVLLLWTYVSALVFLTGAEMASEYGRMREEQRASAP